MVNNAIVQIEGLTAAMLLNAVEDMLNKKLSVLLKPAEPSPDAEFLTRQQIAEMYAVSLPTVHAWTNVGILTAYKIANKTRYKKSEVIAACKPLNRKMRITK